MNRFIMVLLVAVMLVSAGLYAGGQRALAADEPKMDVKERTTLPRKYTLGVWSVAFSPDGKTLALGITENRFGSIKLWDLVPGKEKERATLEGHPRRVNGVAYSLDGKTLASGGIDGTFRLWDLTTGKERVKIDMDPDRVSCVSFSPDGKTVAVGCGVMPFTEQTKPEEVKKPGAITLWDATTGKKLSTWTGHTASVFTLAFSPDGKTLASGSYDFTIKLWDVATGKERTTLPGTTPVYSVAFSPDGKTLASGSLAKTIQLWDVAAGKELAPIMESGVWSVAFSPDGKTLAAGSKGTTIKLWDVATGKEKAALKGHTSSLRCVAFSPDGMTLVSADVAGVIKLWDVRRPTK